MEMMLKKYERRVMSDIGDTYEKALAGKGC